MLLIVVKRIRIASLARSKNHLWTASPNWYSELPCFQLWSDTEVHLGVTSRCLSDSETPISPKRSYPEFFTLVPGYVEKTSQSNFISETMPPSPREGGFPPSSNPHDDLIYVMTLLRVTNRPHMHCPGPTTDVWLSRKADEPIFCNIYGPSSNTKLIELKLHLLGLLTTLHTHARKHNRLHNEAQRSREDLLKEK